MTPIIDFKDLNKLIKKHANNVFFFVDANTHNLCLPILLQELPDLKKYEILEIESGEKSKSLDLAQQLWMAMLELEADRHSLIINVGGGVVTDLGGFLASLYKRGVNFIHVPTSLLAMVDAAYGGKNGVDLALAKNAIGTFNNPEAVVLYPKFLETLPQEQIISGAAEMLKHGLIADKEHWTIVLNTWQNLSPESILRSAQIKTNIVIQDFNEAGIRKTLNFGHTLGHAIESYFLALEKPILHGNAVAAGIICAAYLSHTKTKLPLNQFEEIITSIQNIYPKLTIENNPDVLEWLIHDKKNKDGKLQFVLLTEIGKAIYNQPVTMEEAQNALEFYNKL